MDLFLPRHGEERDLRILTTTTHTTYGGRDSADESKRNLPQPIYLTTTLPAGLKTTTEKKQGLASFGATGERIRSESTTDAKDNTFVQRSWLPNQPLETAYSTLTTDPYEGMAAVPGLGLDMSKNNVQRTTFTKKNDALKDETGIWSG